MPAATPSPNTSRRCNRISRDKYGYTQGLFFAFRGGKCSALSLAAEEERHEGEALKNGAGLLANPRQAPVLAQPNVVPAKATCGWFCAAFATKSTTNPQNGQISVVVLTIRLFFVSVRPVEAFEWPAGGIVERGLGFQNVTLFGNASHFIKR